jgi:ABC-2 type transport system ATP-binding protein
MSADMPAKNDAAVVIEGVTKRFGSLTAVNRLSLTVPAGTIYGFIGPNGSGKTTTLRMIMRILHPDEGTITVLDEQRLGAANDRVAYLPEERGLYKTMRVRELLAFYAALKGRRHAGPLITAWLERMGLGDWGNKKVQTLSKGMAQKVQFIAAVIAEPELVLLDEPFSGLDPLNVEALREAIVDLRKSGTTVIFSTHDMAVAEKMCDFIFMIFKGNKVLDGTLAAIQDAYGRDTIKVCGESLGDLTVLPGVLRVTDFGQYQEVRLVPGADPQQVLQQLLSRGRITHFEIAHPTLQEIFVRIAGAEINGPALSPPVGEKGRE